MLLQSLYGDRLTTGPAGTPEFRVTRAVRPSTPHIYAEIVGGHEERINLEPRVRTVDGADFYHEGIRVFHGNPAEAEDPNSRTTEFGRGKLIDITDAADGIQLGGGSKIGDGGPVDKVALVGEVNGLPVVSDTVLVGLYSSDIVLGPIFVVHFPEGSKLPTTPPVSNPGNADLLDSALNLLIQLRQRV